MRYWVMAVAVAALALPAMARAQAPAGIGTATPQNAAADVAAAMASARTAIAAGRSGEGMNTMAAALKRHPEHLEGTQFLVDTYIKNQRITDALVTYDGYAKAVANPDPSVLASIARADLRQTQRVEVAKAALQAQVHERLARDGDADALAALKKASAAASVVSTEGLAPVVSLARLKDPAAEAKLGSLLAARAPEDRLLVLGAIKDAQARSQAPKVMALLNDPDPATRKSAAITLGILQSKDAVAPLQRAFETDVANVKMSAGIALKQLGQTTADAFIVMLMGSPIVEIRVAAADAYLFSPTKTPQWSQAVKELQADRNPLNRVHAAELLACCDVPSARVVLRQALADPNPLMRAAAARVIEDNRPLADAASARRLLGDTNPALRVYGAGIALMLNRK